MIAVLAIGILSQIAALVFAASIFIGAFSVLWKIKPTQAAIRFLARQFGTPMVDSVKKQIREIVHEETTDLRMQLYPNGGSSLADKINRIRRDVALVCEGVEDVNRRLDEIHRTGEIPATPGMKQPRNLQI